MKRTFALALAALLLVACQGGPASPTPSPPPSSPPPPVTVVVEDGRYGVSTLTIPAGTTVIFRNEGGLRHTATHSENGFPLPEPLFDIELEPGTEGSYTFEEPGSYQVTCVPHPVMVLTITVE